MVDSQQIKELRLLRSRVKLGEYPSPELAAKINQLSKVTGYVEELDDQKEPTRERSTKDLSWLDQGRGGALVGYPKLKASKLFHQDKGLLDSSARWLADKWNGLESRYGRAQALTMLAAMLATAPIPGNIAAVIAAGEAARYFRGSALVANELKALMGYQVKGSYFEECERDEDGHCLPSGQAGSKKPDKTNKPSPPKLKPSKLNSRKPATPSKKPGKTKVPEQVPSEKAARAKANHKLVNKDIQRYAEEYNEPRFAKLVKGKSYPDSEPMDIVTKTGDLVELKTMVDNGNNKITMDSYSQIRKIVKEQEAGRPFHTVVCDDQAIYDPSGNHDESKGRTYYYRRGVAGSARIDGMYKCKDEKELLKVMSLPDKELPQEAQRTDGKHRIGKWVAFQDDKGKGFRNKKTGQEFRAKK